LEFLGFDENQEILTDGLQVLRYKSKQAYTSHPDYLPDVPTHWYDYGSEGVGANRFATVLLYMSDISLDEGGETVFVEAPPHGTDVLVPMDEAVRQLRTEAPEVTEYLEEGSWEEELAALCRTRLAVKPRSGRAVCK
jgi:hypothetical protein